MTFAQVVLLKVVSLNALYEPDLAKRVSRLIIA